MAGDDDDRKSAWSSWLAPGDTRHAKGDRQHPDLTEHGKCSTELSSKTEPLVQPANTDADSHELNPFIAFKHYVDGKFAALADFSSNLAELRKKSLKEQALYQATARDHYKRWTGNDGAWPPDHMFRRSQPPPVTDEAKAAADMVIEEARRRNCNVPIQKISALFEEDDDFDHVTYNRERRLLIDFDPLKQNNQILPSTSELLSRDWRKINRQFDRTHWLSIDWFKHNPYSPVNLEADPDLSKYDTKWRNAFEDLLEAALDKPMTSQERFGQRLPHGPVTSTWRGPGVDWMLSLQCRGILPPQLPSLHCHLLSESSLFPNYLFSKHVSSVTSLPASEHPPSMARTIGLHTAGELAHYEYLQLINEIAIPLPRNNTTEKSELKFTGDDVDIVDHRLALLRKETAYRSQGNQVTSTESRCPDDLGRAIGDAARTNSPALQEREELVERTDAQMKLMLQAHDKKKAELMRELTASISDWDWEGITPEERQQWREGRTSSGGQRYDGGPITELDVYEYMDRHGDSYPQSGKPESACSMHCNDSSASRCPDELGRAVGEAARQQAARAFADEENDLNDDDWIERLDTRNEDLATDQARTHHWDVLRDLMHQLKDADGVPTVDEFKRLRGLLSENLDRLLYQQMHLTEDDALLFQVLQALKQERDRTGRQDAGDDSLQQTMQAAAKHFATKEAALQWAAFQAAMDVQSSSSYDELFQMLDANMDTLLREHKLMRDEQAKISKTIEALREDREANKAAKIGGSRQVSDEPFSDSLAAQANVGKPGVLSTLTTTQTTRLPDGSVKTTVVLRRRFADGREETQESTQTSFDEGSATSAGDDRESRKEKKKGWFWN